MLVQRVAPPLYMQKKISEYKKNEIRKLLLEMEHTPMDREQMATFLGITYKSLCKYITVLKKEHALYIHSYRGKTVVYMAGNKPNAEKPKLTQYEMRKASKLRKEEELKNQSKVRMDVAASWMFNPC